MATQRHKTNMNHMRSEATSFEQGGGGNNWMKLVEGKNVIRILPPWSEEGKVFQRVGFHRPPGKMTEKVTCPNFTFEEKGKCTICKRRKKVFDQQGKDAARLYAPQKRAYLNVLDMKKADGQVYVLEVGPMIMNPILNFMAEEASDDLVDPNKGFNILITRKNEAGFTKYDVMVKPRPFDLEEKGYDVEDILKNLVDLSALVKESDPDEMQDILDTIDEKVFGDEGGAPKDDDDDDDAEEEKPRKKKAAPSDDDDDDEPAPKKKAAPADDDDDEPRPKKKAAPADDDDDEPTPKKKAKAAEPEDDDDEPAPKSKMKRKAADEDDEDAPAPKKKAKKLDDDDDLDDVDDVDTDFDADQDIPW